MKRQFLVLFSIFILTIMTGCNILGGESPSEVVATAAVSHVETGQIERVSGEPVTRTLNWCGGRGTLIEEISRAISVTVQVNIEGEIEIEGAIGREGLAEVRGRVAAFYALSQGQQITWEAGREAEIPPGTYIEYDLQPVEVWKTGVVTVFLPLIGRQEYPYEVLADIGTNIIESRDIPCDEAPETTGTEITVTATGPASTTTISSQDDFSNPEWYNNPTQYRNYSGVCDYEGDGSVGRLISSEASANFCSFTVMNPNGAEFIPLEEMGVYSADVAIESGDGFMGQGIGLFSATGWWLTCTLRQDDANSFFAVFETQAPDGFNQYLVKSASSATVRLEVMDGNLVCSHDGLVTGRVALSELPIGASDPVALVMNSNRPAGDAVTTIDNITLER
ncbi:MAG: hypothetical protein AAF846_02620 [Chloroflexota bacterium]